MNELDIAYLVLVTAARADGGCVPCVQGCVDEGVKRHPELPWEEAAERIRPTATRKELEQAVASSRSWLDTGGFPRHPGRLDPVED
jgi:hypothetical protein